jgi:hypothetical protein
MTTAVQELVHTFEVSLSELALFFAGQPDELFCKALAEVVEWTRRTFAERLGHFLTPEDIEDIVAEMERETRNFRNSIESAGTGRA